MSNIKELKKKCTLAWVVAVDMGYGHQRPAHALKCLAYGSKVINANNYKGIPKKDQKIWRSTRKIYEWVSRFKIVPLLGPIAWYAFDKMQKIKPFYPKRDLSKPNLQLNAIYNYIEKGWGLDLIEKLNIKDIPLITTFFAVAFMAEEYNYRNDIYCVVTDTDISRAWVAKHPNTSRIKYFCPNKRTFDRLKLYGVRNENLFLTGFPLPFDNIGDNNEVIKKDLLLRISKLDPQKLYFHKYKHILDKILGIKKVKYQEDGPVSVTFAVGGAGAQREIGLQIAKSLKYSILNNKIALTLVAGIHNDLHNYFKREVKKIGLGSRLGKNLNILFASNKEKYFAEFDELMRTTDILWSKPSELSFYSALGIPIIMAPPIGSQEDFNKIWLKTVGSGISQLDPRYANEWLFEWLDSGWLAEAAVEGYVDAPKYGVYNIAQIISQRPTQVRNEEIILQY